MDGESLSVGLHALKIADTMWLLCLHHSLKTYVPRVRSMQQLQAVTTPETKNNKEGIRGSAEVCTAETDTSGIVRRLLCLYSDPKEAGMKLSVLDKSGQLTPLNTPYSSFGSISVGRSGKGLALATVGGSPTRASEAALLLADDVDGLIRSTPDDWQVLRKSAAVEVSSTQEM